MYCHLKNVAQATTWVSVTNWVLRNCTERKHAVGEEVRKELVRVWAIYCAAIFAETDERRHKLQRSVLVVHVS